MVDTDGVHVHHDLMPTGAQLGAPALPGLLEGAATIYRGHDGIAEMLRDFYEVLNEIRFEYSEIQDLGDRVVAIGEIRVRGKASGAETRSPYANVANVSNGKGVRIRGYLDPEEALEAARLDE